MHCFKKCNLQRLERISSQAKSVKKEATMIYYDTLYSAYALYLQRQPLFWVSFFPRGFASFMHFLLLLQMFERETRREKILEARNKEIRLKEKTKGILGLGGGGAKGAGGGALSGIALSALKVCSKFNFPPKKEARLFSITGGQSCSGS